MKIYSYYNYTRLSNIWDHVSTLNLIKIVAMPDPYLFFVGVDTFSTAKQTLERKRVLQDRFLHIRSGKTGWVLRFSALSRSSCLLCAMNASIGLRERVLSEEKYRFSRAHNLVKTRVCSSSLMIGR
jgi:hypothetical protein